MSVAAARELGDLALQAAQLNHLAWSQAACYRRYQRCVEHAVTAHRIAAEAGDVRQQAWALAYAAYGYRELGDFGRCADFGRRAAALALEAGDQEAYSQALARLGDGLHGLGRPGEAMDVRLRLAALLTTPGIGIHPELAAVTLAGVYVQLGDRCAEPGDWTQAAAYYEMAARLLRTRDVPSFEAAVRMALGRALAELGQRDEARAQFDAARVLFLDLNDDEGAERAESAISACGSAWSPASGAAYRGREHRRQGGNPQ
jgi:tetratricopeptide (TPR) repeat protein